MKKFNRAECRGTNHRSPEKVTYWWWNVLSRQILNKFSSIDKKHSTLNIAPKSCSLWSLEAGSFKENKLFLMCNNWKSAFQNLETSWLFRNRFSLTIKISSWHLLLPSVIRTLLVINALLNISPCPGILLSWQGYNRSSLKRKEQTKLLWNNCPSPEVKKCQSVVIHLSNGIHCFNLQEMTVL